MSAIFQNTSLLILAALVTGILLLALITTQLGKKIGISPSAQFFLAFLLGFGMISVTIKLGIMAYIGSLSREELVPDTRTLQTNLKKRPAIMASSKTDPTSGWKAWQALPLKPIYPADNKQNCAKIALGSTLFLDVNLSRDRTISCASCHNLTKGGDDNRATSIGVNGLTGDRNAPTVINAAFLTRLFWDGRSPSLEDQAKQPLINPVEMAMPSWDSVVTRVREDEHYISQFQKAFPQAPEITIDKIAQAIAAYERTLITPNAPYDRFIRGDDIALSAAQLRGMRLFQKTNCRSCHIDPTFSSAGTAKNFGTYRRFPVFPDNEYIAKYDLLLDGKPGRFRVPSLRNVAETAPYFHNGAVESLEEAVRIMAVSQLNKTLSNDPQQDVRITPGAHVKTREHRKVYFKTDQALSDQDIQDIVAFLKSLSDPLPADSIQKQEACDTSPDIYTEKTATPLALITQKQAQQ